MSPIRVLVVDDYAPFQRFVCSTLEQRPELQIVGKASDGLEAVQKAAELQPELILLDIGLPTLNGIEVARQILKLAPHSKILFLSQESSPDVVQKVFDLGALGYVVKAHARNELLAAVNAVGKGRHFVSRGLSGYTFGVVVKSESPFRSFRDLLDYAKANPGKLSYGSTGTGTSPHLLMEEVSIKTGVQFLHVPFKGNADSTQALLGGQIMAQSDSSSWGRFVDAGQFRLLVTFGKERTKHWPTVPTANDLGLDMVYSSPYGIVGPHGLEPKVVKILHDGFKKALEDPEDLKVLEQLDQELWYQSSEDYAKYARETLRKERALIERLGLLAK